MDGSHFEGEYFKSMKHGNGKFVWNDGSVYDGQWKYDDFKLDDARAGPPPYEHMSTEKRSYRIALVKEASITNINDVLNVAL